MTEDLDNKVEKNIEERNLLGGHIALNKSSQKFHLKERLNLVYEDNISLIQQYILDQKQLNKLSAIFPTVKAKQLNNYEKTLFLFVKTIEAGEFEVIEKFADDAIEAFSFIYNYGVDQLNIDTVRYLLKYVINLKRISHYDKTFTNRLSVKVSSLNISLLISVLESKLIQQHTDTINIDYISPDESMRHNRLVETTCTLKMKILGDLPYYKVISLDLDELGYNFDFYIKALGEEKFLFSNNQESSVKSLIKLYYFFKETGNNDNILLSQKTQVISLLDEYFKYLKEVLTTNNQNITRTIISSQLADISGIFKKQGEGTISLYFNLFSMVYDGSFTNAIQTYKSAESFGIEKLTTPPFIDDFFNLKNLILSIYIYQIELNNEISINNQNMLKEIDGLFSLNKKTSGDYKKLDKEILFILELYKNGKILQVDDIDLRGFHREAQAMVLIRILFANSRSNSFINNDLLKNLFDVIDNKLLNNANVLSKIFNNEDFTPSDFDPVNFELIAEKYFFYINFSEDNKFCIEHVEFFASEISNLLRFIFVNAEVVENYRMLYQILLFFLHHNFVLEDRNIVFMLEKEITEKINQYYEGLDFYHWALEDKSIMEETKLLSEQLITKINSYD